MKRTMMVSIAFAALAWPALAPAARGGPARRPAEERSDSAERGDRAAHGQRTEQAERDEISVGAGLRSGKSQGPLRYVNDAKDSPERHTGNCAQCVIATYHTLHDGRLSSALPRLTGGNPTSGTKGSTPISEVERYFGGKFVGGMTPRSVDAAMTSAGPGAQGVVMVDFKLFGISGKHVFNVANIDGEVRYFDGGKSGDALKHPYRGYKKENVSLLLIDPAKVDPSALTKPDAN